MTTADCRCPGLDASTAIILYRAGLLQFLGRAFTVNTVQTVVDETARGEDGDLISAMLKGWKVYDRPAEGPFGPGENGLLALWSEGVIDALFTDDGSCLRYCRTQGIPHYSAIVIPYLLHIKGVCDREAGRESLERVMACGRYAEWVIDHAREMWGFSNL